MKEKQAWVESLNFLRVVYMGKKIFDWEDDRRSHKDDIDVRVMNLIMDEHEGTPSLADKFMHEITPKLNFDKILKAKKLKNYFDMISPKIVKNHVMCGFVKKTSGQQIDQDVADTDSRRKTGLLSIAGLSNILPQNMMSWKEEFFVIVTSRGFAGPGVQPDENLITESDVPPWFDLDTLYMFKYENEEDESEFFKKYNGKQILMAEPASDSSFKGKYNFVLELKEKVYFVGCEFCKEVNRWIAALRKAKQNAEENSRAKGNGPLRNIDRLIGIYKRKVG